LGFWFCGLKPKCVWGFVNSSHDLKVVAIDSGTNISKLVLKPTIYQYQKLSFQDYIAFLWLDKSECQAIILLGWLDYHPYSLADINMGKKIYIQTFGCQMNVYDSERLTGMLHAAGHSLTKIEKEAEVIVLNTCSVREKAERRALGRLTDFYRYKQQNPDVILVAAGCMAQRMGGELLQKHPFLDMVLGPDQIFQLPQLISNHHNTAQVKVHSSREDFESEEIWKQEVLPKRKTPFTSFVAISRGCDNFCSYCVVPYVRGPERNRPSQQIIREVQLIAESGAKEVTLLGQNVNSYRYEGRDFADLLQMVNDKTDIAWIRFMTSHPKDLSDKLIEKIAFLPKVCRHIHLPLQSGSDKILEKMNRGYTAGDYLRLVKRIKERIGDISLTTDVIVGFPSESQDDFHRTMEMMKTVEFDSAFMFRYSVREGTKAAALPDDVPEEEKLKRLYELINLQKGISKKRNQRFLGKMIKVLVDEKSRRDRNKWKGKAQTNQTVIIDTPEDVLGKIVTAEIDEVDSFTLFGKQ
jgi:tRNA-2-methylthio-N6-dimethylallyladenosine synthase